VFRLLTTPRRGRLLTPALVVVVAACSLGQSQDLVWRDGRLKARPRTVSGTPVSGFAPLAIGRDRDGVLFIPRAAARGPVPLVVMLHGAGGSAQGIRRRLFGGSDSLDFALLIPDSRGPTWDAIRGIYGPDIAFLDSALRIVFARVSIDPSRVIVSGFSDGASYALAVGRMNGDLFTRIVAFSPGFVPPSTAEGKPEVYITHGDNDPILPFEDTSQRIAPMLSRAGYEVTLKTFTGGHTVPAELMHEAFAWALAARRAQKPK
jgi:phospholipase/carboxylesterase